MEKLLSRWGMSSFEALIGLRHRKGSSRRWWVSAWGSKGKLGGSVGGFSDILGQTHDTHWGNTRPGEEVVPKESLILRPVDPKGVLGALVNGRFPETGLAPVVG